jgi:hypothetical protein
MWADCLNDLNDREPMGVGLRQPVINERPQLVVAHGLGASPVLQLPLVLLDSLLELSK